MSPADSTGTPAPSLRPEPFLSIVIPVYNEEEVLPLLLERLRRLLDALPGGAEAWFVNDGSQDHSSEILVQEAQRDPRIMVLELSRNFGHPIAITAGLDHAEGDAVVVMDADLQDPPEIIPQLIARYREGFDVVHARRSARHDETAVKRFSARLFYKIMRLTTDHPPEIDVGEFRLMSRDVVASLRIFRERHRLVRGLVKWLGFRQTTLDFERPGRAAGVTKYPFAKMLRLSWDAMTSFSVAPLRVATLLGAAALLLAVALSAYALYARFVLALALPGWTALGLLNLFSSGVVLLSVGVIGEYVGRIFEEVKGRPLYVIQRKVIGTPRKESSGSG